MASGWAQRTSEPFEPAVDGLRNCVCGDHGCTRDTGRLEELFGDAVVPGAVNNVNGGDGGLVRGQTDHSICAAAAGLIRHSEASANHWHAPFRMPFARSSEAYLHPPTIVAVACTLTTRSLEGAVNVVKRCCECGMKVL